MAKEYIEREAFREVLRKSHEAHANNCREEVLLDRDIRLLNEQPAADVVEVVRPDEAVLAEFEDDYKDFEKIKTNIAQIIVEGKVEKPYYSILWWDEKSKEYNIGYSSYCLDYVRKWLELVFDVVEEADVVEVVRCAECKHWKHFDHLGCTDFVKVCGLANYMIGANGYCLYGERRTDE